MVAAKINTKCCSIDLTTYKMYAKIDKGCLFDLGRILFMNGYECSKNVNEKSKREGTENLICCKRVKEFLMCYFPKISNKSPLWTAAPYESICLGER